MGTLRQRHVVLEKVAMFMLEQGKVLSKHEYDTMKQVVPLRSGLVLNHFGSWSRMLNIIENNLPDVWAEIKKKENPPPPPPKPEPKPEPKPAPKAAPQPKPAAPKKPVEKVEESNE